jgi:virulence-associated protein VagC
MTLGSVFTNNRTQAVRLPAEVRFPDSVSKVPCAWSVKNAFFRR